MPNEMRSDDMIERTQATNPHAPKVLDGTLQARDGRPLRPAIDGLLPVFRSRVAGHDDDGSYVAQNMADLREAGVFSALVPRELGGGGVPHAELVAWIRAIGRACPSTALTLSMHQHLVATSLWNHRHGRPGEALLRRVASEGLQLVSTGARDYLASEGTLTPVEGGFRLRARKSFASGCEGGDLLVSSARLEHPDGATEVLHFALPLRGEGVRIERDWSSMGMRGTGSHTVVIEDALVPEASVTLRRPAGSWHPLWAVVLTAALPLIMAAYVGLAEEAAEIAIARAARSAGDDLTALAVGRLTLERTAAVAALDGLVANAGDLDFDPDLAHADTALRYKTLAARAVRATVEAAFDVAGGAAFYRFLGLERLVRDAYGADLHPLPAPKQQLFSGRLALGLDPVAS